MLQIVTIWIGYPERERFFMKKTLITTLILFAWTMFSPAFSAVEMDYQDTITTITSLGVERKLIINSNDDSRYRIEVRSLANTVSNSSGTVEIPLANFVINNNTQDIDFIDSEFSTLYSNVTFNGVPQIVTAKIKDYGMVPMGTYNIGLQMQATNLDTSEITSTMFNLRLVVEKTQNIAITGSGSQFNMSASNALTKNARITNESNLPITVNSNCNWVLVLKTDAEFGTTPGNYYVRTIGGSSNVTQRLQENVLLEESKEIILAKGNAFSSNEEVDVQFTLESRDGEFIPAGNYNNRVKYLIREDS